jgi:hypothetical protein
MRSDAFAIVSRGFQDPSQMRFDHRIIEPDTAMTTAKTQGPSKWQRRSSSNDLALSRNLCERSLQRAAIAKAIDKGSLANELTLAPLTNEQRTTLIDLLIKIAPSEDILE